ncbi:MAG: hypothetical protein U1F53_10840 [Burkholderiaceae bacterium]
MPHPVLRPWRLLPAALLCAATWPALASSSAASSAAEGSSASIGSVSDSFKSSSNSSTTRTAQGDYRVTDVAAADGQPGMLRLTLAPAGGDTPREPLELTLPQAAVERGRLALGELVTAQPRAWRGLRAAGRAAAGLPGAGRRLVPRAARAPVVL